MAIASNFLIAGNDEHGQQPFTSGKRTPPMPYIDRPFYENEFNRPTKNFFLANCAANGFRVFDVKPEITDTSISTRVVRTNNSGASLVVTFAYNAFGDGTSFNDASGFIVFYSTSNAFATQSRLLSFDIDSGIDQFVDIRNRGVQTLSNVGMLQNVRMPASLIEGGFMTNLNDAKLMVDPDYQEDHALGATQGVSQFLDTPFTATQNYQTLPVLRRGERGNFVTYLQYMLKNNGFELDADGIFGGETEFVVENFQLFNNLTIDGIVGKATWGTLLRQLAFPTLRRGESNSYVRYLQQKLLSKLYYGSVIDGIFGGGTDSAVRQFQEDNGLVVDGIVGRNTWEKVRVVGGGRE